MRGLTNYVLADDGRTPVPTDDILEWGAWFEHHNRALVSHRVGVFYTGYRYLVSTVFLGLDHNFGFSGDPVLWETMIFYEPAQVAWHRHYRRRGFSLSGPRIRYPHEPLGLNDSQWRYTSADEAEADHYVRVNDVAAAIDAFRRRPHARARIVRLA